MTRLHPIFDNSRTYQWVDNLSVIRGRHSMKMGGDARRLYDDATTNNWPFGNISFTGDLTGNAMADYILGFPKTTPHPRGSPDSPNSPVALRILLLTTTGK